jgi:formamidopyrimidine-DNA glycosylase
MPELPEVESVRRQLEPELKNRRVENVWWDPHPAIPRQFMGLELLAGRRVLGVGRRGKFMLAPLDEDLELILHLGMTGSFRFDLQDPHVRAKLFLDDGRTLSFRDMRRFGRMAVVEAGDYEGIPTLKLLGPEPMTDEFDPDVFAASLKRTNAPIKPFLLSQRPVAGVGNIYADEALFLARVNPRRRARLVKALDCDRIVAAVQQVMLRSIETGGSSISDYVRPGGERGSYQDERRVYGRKGEPCSVCATAIKRIVLGARSTHFCPLCQRR